MFPKHNIVLVLFFITASFQGAFSSGFPKFLISEVSVFDYPNQNQSKILVMDYASYIIENPEDWDNKDHRKQVVQVDIVFTKYPFHKEDWITHYDSLLKNRIEAITELEPSVRKSQVKWNLIIQTRCKSEEEAKTLFHGAVLWYKEVPMVTAKAPKVAKVKPVKVSENILELTSNQFKFPDSTVFKVLERNSHWNNMLIVNDWTASMYQFGSQAVLWYKAQLSSKKVSRFAFFNDGDNKKLIKGKGIYFADPKNIDQVIQVMQKVQKNGNGGDSPEKYIEALLTSVDKTKEFNELILIADNKSSIKDLAQLKELKVPVRVLICGITKGETIKHDYLQLASTTNGSIHTIQEDIYDVADIKEGERVKILEVEYQRTKGRIVKYKPVHQRTQF